MPTGACCIDFACSEQAQADCLAQGGEYFGDGKACAPGLCDKPNPCPGVGDCCSDNGTPGCDDQSCCELICGQDPFCCDTSWDGICADAAIVECEVCAPPTGACCIDFECSTQTQADCLAQGGEYFGDGESCAPGICDKPNPCPGDGDCCSDNGTPGCDDGECCELICSQDSFCCETSWDSICADAANDQCAVCIPEPVCPGEGSCCTPNGTPGCDVPDCCELICGQDPFCCEVEWDQICVDQAVEASPCGSIFCDPPPPPCPGEGDCCEANGTPGCDDADCCTLVCLADPFCCDTAWDDVCAAAAIATCEECIPEPDPCPEDITGDGVIDSADLNDLLFAFGMSGDGDVDGDGDTDSQDLNLLLFLFGQPCPE
jgi:hypothetical protein